LSASQDDRDPTRRTWLAAERTWLAWWRSGIAAAAAAIAVGRPMPELVGGSQVGVALERDDYAGVSVGLVAGLTIPAVVLALGTLTVIVADA
jgi:uncharacterized membrane protein YidH (DUF202 family)